MGVISEQLMGAVVEGKRITTTSELQKFMMGPGWKVIKDDPQKETWYSNQDLGYIIVVRHQSWARHRPVIVRWEGGEQDGFGSVPAALEWIKKQAKR